MVRVGHIADIHLTEGARGKATVDCLQFVARDGAEQGVQLWIVAGDLSGTTVPHSSTDWEREQLDIWFQSLARQAPVVILWGNHDKAEDIKGYGRLDPMAGKAPAAGEGSHQIIACVSPDLVACGQAQLALMPYPHPQVVNVCGFSAGESVREKMEGDGTLIRAKLQRWAEWIKEKGDPGLPTILAAHINIAGSETFGDEILGGKEIELFETDLDAFPADYIALGHIHKHQQMSAKAYYPGTPAPQNFGEAGQQFSYIIADVGAGAQPVVHRRFTPAAALVNVTAKWDGGWQIDHASVADLQAFAGAEVRVKVQIPEELREAVPWTHLEEAVMKLGAASVRLDKRVVPTKRVRSSEIGSAHTTAQKLEAYWNTMTPAPSRELRDNMLAKLAELEQG